jgi:hypothetical protein
MVASFGSALLPRRGNGFMKGLVWGGALMAGCGLQIRGPWGLLVHGVLFACGGMDSALRFGILALHDWVEAVDRLGYCSGSGY